MKDTLANGAKVETISQSTGCCKGSAEAEKDSATECCQENVSETGCCEDEKGQKADMLSRRINNKSFC